MQAPKSVRWWRFVGATMQMQLPINTEFELVTAEQLAWSKGRDIPSQEDLVQAEKMVAKWNLIRISRNQKPLI